MMEDVEEAVEEWIRDPSHAVFQHESQDADNEQDDRSVTPTFAPSLLEVIHESEDISLEQRFGSV